MNLIPKFRCTSYEGASVNLTRQEEWNKRYKELDIKKENISRLKNTCYFDIFEKYLISKNLEKNSIKVLELACGTAPFTKLANDKNIDALATDYSEVMIDRLKKEFNFKAKLIDLWKIDKSIGSFDIIVLAGGVYESSDYKLPEVLYSQLIDILNKNGIIIQFLNRYDNLANRGMLLNYWIRNLFKFKNYKIIRKIFRKKTLFKYHKFWLMSPDYIKYCGEINKLKVIETSPLRLTCGILDFMLWGFYPFNFYPFKNFKIYDQDSAESNKNQIFYNSFLKLHSFIKNSEKLRNKFSMSYCVVFKK